MTREIILVRHGKAQTRSEERLDDERMLTRAGKMALEVWLPRVAALVRADGAKNVAVWASPTVRTLETAHMVAEALEQVGLPVGEITCESSLYEQDIDAFEAAVRASGADVVVAVGHNPFCELAAEQLSGSDVRFATGGALALRLSAAEEEREAESPSDDAASDVPADGGRDMPSESDAAGESDDASDAIAEGDVANEVSGESEDASEASGEGDASGESDVASEAVDESDAANEAANESDIASEAAGESDAASEIPHGADAADEISSESEAADAEAADAEAAGEGGVADESTGESESEDAVALAANPEAAVKPSPTDSARLLWFVQGPESKLWKNVCELEGVIAGAADNVEARFETFFADPADVEAAHKARVSIRTLRGLLAFVAPFQSAKQGKDMQRDLRDCVRLTSRLRELDVLSEQVAELDPPADELLAACARAREAECKKTIRALQSKAYRKRLSRALKAARNLKWKRGVVRFGIDASVVRARFEQLAERVDEDVAALDLSDAERTHDVRKQAKQVRYAAERFERLVGEGAADAAERMKGVQDRLGALCDARVNVDIADDFPAKGLSEQAKADLERFREQNEAFICAALETE